MQKNIKLGIIGLGNIGLSLLNSFDLEEKQKIYAYDIDKHRLASLRHCLKCKNLSEMTANANVLILAIKPQDISIFIKKNNKYLAQYKPLLISVAAGIKTTFFEKLISKIRIIRVMPNLAIKVKESISFISGGKFITKNDLKITQEIFSKSGKIIFANENQLDNATAISGSGPGYLFFFMEILYKNAINLGFSRNTARLMVLQTFQGAVSLAKSNEEFKHLMSQVTSKNGTTEAAFKVFKQKNLSTIVTEGIKAANKRSWEISSKLCAKNKLLTKKTQKRK